MVSLGCIHDPVYHWATVAGQKCYRIPCGSLAVQNILPLAGIFANKKKNVYIPLWTLRLALRILYAPELYALHRSLF